MLADSTANLFLAALSPKDMELLRPHLRPVELRQGTVLADPGAKVEEILFIESGMISITTTMEDGAAIELASLGKEAVVGCLAALGTHRANARAIVQIAGSGLRIGATDYRALMPKSPAFLKIVLLSNELSMAQMQQTAACNALHSAERRMCRWIIQVRDRVGDDVLRLTHDFVAQMLAVRRPTVTLIAQELQNAGLIRYRRGVVDIIDRAGLEALTCECYGVIRNNYERLLPPER